MTYILVDTANTFFRARHVVRGDADIKLGMALHITFNSIKKAWNDFGGTHVVFCLEGRSWRKDFYKPYTTRGLQTALHRLQQISEYNEGIAIRIISQSIANGWQGLFPLDNKRGNHQHDRPRGKDITADDLARLVAKRYGPRFPELSRLRPHPIGAR